MAISSRRTYNDSKNGGGVNNSSNVKRNNFLSMLGPGAAEDNQGNPSGVKSPESHSQPNPPTLRKITLNQRIMQKNMARVSGNN